MRCVFVTPGQPIGFIGIGVRPPTSSWGTMINEGYSLIFSSPHLVAVPAAAIAVTMLAFTFMGDGLRDALDPRARSERFGR